MHRFILYLYHHCPVTRPLILDQLLELGVGFRDYLRDRLSGGNLIASLPYLMRQRVLESPG
ncbi:MAG: hypothetical protein AB1646_03845 [Thermodesulfobacteriota bacterium]